MASDWLTALLAANQKLHLKIVVSYPCFYPRIALVAPTPEGYVHMSTKKVWFNHNKTKHKKLQWRHDEHVGDSNHQPSICLFNRLFRHRSKKTSKLRVAGLCEGNSHMTGEFLTQRTSNAEKVSVSWRHHSRAYFMGYILQYIPYRRVIKTVECDTNWYRLQKCSCN